MFLQAQKTNFKKGRGSFMLSVKASALPLNHLI